ncbi:CehA/McbA family metallohydrolase [Aestuariivirga sp.]|uniref:CehA/McbA family metallohydrolase n=1 Tax=Aestuariivirga sp. TaxID=2650926 RepID=UPI0039194949
MALLAPFAAPGRFWRGNLHTHSNLSDGALEPKAVVEAYKNAGYDFMQLSEHFIGNFDFPMADTRAFRSNNFTTIIGCELHAPETAVGELWHIVAAGLPLDFPRNFEGETGAQVARRAHEAGAFIGIAHPAWSQLTIEDGRSIDCAHAVEIYNHGCAIENDRGDGWYLLDQMLTEGRRLTAFATDDAHFKTPDHFGGWVHVKADSLDPDALLASLKQGLYYSSMGPQIHAIELNGKEISISCSPVDTITVLCGTSRTALRNGRAITEASFDLSKLEKGWLLRKQSGWFRVVAIDNAGKRAWSNPIWWDEIR